MKLKNLKNFSWSLFLILLLASFLRLYKLGVVPPHLTPDEASLGYNAYSILKTGKDEFGSFLPVIFKSFGDYKPGLYVYATIPFVAAFGLSEWVVRLPSALAGIVSVVLIYLIVKVLVSRQKTSEEKKWKAESIAAFVAATNPWLIYFSRAAWEVNLALTLTLAGIYFFLKSLEKSRFLKISSAFFALTFLTYQGAKLSTFIVLLVLTISFWSDCKKLITNSSKSILISAVLGTIIILPVILSFFRGQTGRLQVFSLFSYRRPTEFVQQILSEGDEKIYSPGYYLFHSEGFYQLHTFLNHYFNHFSGKFLFFEGDWQNPRHTAPNSGVMLLFDLFLLPLGFWSLASSENKKIKSLIFLWLFLSPLPAVLSRDQVHAVRALNMSVPLIIITSFGIHYLISRLNLVKNHLLKITFIGGFVFLFLGSFVYFLDSYFVHVKIHQANDWFFGYREAVREVDTLRTKHKNVLFIQSYAQPYIYFLFYRAMDNPNFDPETYQESLIKNFADNSIDVGLVGKLDNISFAGFSWPAPAVSGDIVVGTPIDIPDFYANDMFKMIDEIRQPNGNPAFRIVEKL